MIVLALNGNKRDMHRVSC